MPSLRQLGELLFLTRSLARPRGAIHIVIGGRNGEWAVDQLRRRLPDGIAFAIVNELEELSQVCAPGHVVLIPLQEPQGHGHSLARALNLHRERLAGEVLHTVVLLDDEAALVELQRVAPDLWSFRHRTYALADEPNEVLDDTRRRARLRDAIVDRIHALAPEPPVPAADIGDELMARLGGETLWEHAGLWLDDGRDHQRLDPLIRYLCLPDAPLPSAFEPWQEDLSAVRARFALGVGDRDTLVQLPPPTWRANPVPQGETAIAAVGRLLEDVGTTWITGGSVDARADLASAAGLVLRSRYDAVVTLDGRPDLEAAITRWLGRAGRRGPNLGLTASLEHLRSALGRRKVLFIIEDTTEDDVAALRRTLPGSGIIASSASSSVSRKIQQQWSGSNGLAVGALDRDLLEALLARLARESQGEQAEALRAQILEIKRRLRTGGTIQIGDLLGDRYRLDARIGEGGFATIYRAWDTVTRRPVAVKVLHGMHAKDRSLRERFFRGARMMAKLDHPNIARVLMPEAEDQGFYYYVMEHYPGGDLRQAVLNGRIEREELIPLILEIGRGLAVAHAHWLLHRDVKPSNVLLDAAGSPKLTDFDLVLARDTTGGTRTGALGTFIYAAPELLAEHPSKADARADVYGLAMVAIFALHGRDLPIHAFRDTNTFIDGLDTNAAVKDVLKRAVDWDRDRRPATVEAFCQDLADAARSIDPPHREP